MSSASPKYQVPPKLFKKLGSESFAEENTRTSQRLLLSPKTVLARKGKTQVLVVIPRVIRESIDYLREEERDRTLGLFRIPGNSENVDKLLEKFESPEFEEVNILEKFRPPVHDVANLMKRYLIRTPQGLIGDEDKKDLLNIVAKGIKEDKDKQLMAYEVVVRALMIEESQRTCLAFVLRFLLAISGEQEDGRMTVEALARMFAPIVIRDYESKPIDQLKLIDQMIILTEILIWNALELFKY